MYGCMHAHIIKFTFCVCFLSYGHRLHCHRQRMQGCSSILNVPVGTARFHRHVSPLHGRGRHPPHTLMQSHSLPHM